MNPDDYPWAVSDIDLSKDGVFIYDARVWKRATAQNDAAQHLGVAFRDVRCTRAYIVMFTRQQLWNDYGRDRYFDAMLFQRGYYGYYFAGSGYGSEGWYCDFTHRPIPRNEIESLRKPAVCPADWEPPSDLPAFTWTNAHHWRAIPVWHAEPW